MMYLLILSATLISPTPGEIRFPYDTKFTSEDVCIQHLTAFKGHEAEMLNQIFSQTKQSDESGEPA
jgi:hypothetical protein